MEKCKERIKELNSLLVQNNKEVTINYLIKLKFIER